MPQGINLNVTSSTVFDAFKIALPNLEWDDRTKMHMLLQRHNYTLLTRLLDREKETADGGTHIERQLIYKSGQGFTWSRAGAERDVASVDAVAKVVVPWAGGYGAYQLLATELRREMASLVRLKAYTNKQRAVACEAALSDVDDALWAPPDTTENDKPYGVPYHFPPVTSTQVTAGTGTGAHQGEHCSGFTDWCDIDRSDSTGTHTRAQTYNAAWNTSAGFGGEDDMKRVQRMLRRLRYRVPSRLQKDIKEVQMRTALFTDETNIEALGEFLRRRNDDTGKSLGRGYMTGIGDDGAPIISGMDVEWAEALDTASATYRGYHPLYCLNFGCMNWVFEKGGDWKEDPAPGIWNRPDVQVVYIDLAGNLLVENPQRAGGVVSYPA